MPEMSRHSSRSRMLFWLLGLVAVSLLAIVLTTRTVLQGAVPEKANEDVVQELEEFRSLAADGVDPETSEPFASNTRLLEVFLSRQVPTKDESLFGIVDGRVISPPLPDGRSLSAGDPLVQQARESQQPSGVYVPVDGAPVHWGTVDVDGGESARDVTLMVARYTDSDYREITELTHVVTVVSGGVLIVAAFLAWLITGKLLWPIRRVSQQVAKDCRAGEATRLDFDGTDELSELARAYNDAWVREHEVREINRSITAVAAREIQLGTREPEKLRATSESLMALSRLAPGTLGIETTDTDLDGIVREIDPHADIIEGSAVLNRQVVIDALRAAAGLLRAGINDINVGARTEAGIVRLWVNAPDYVTTDAQAAAMISWPVTSTYSAVVRTVADAHGGSATITVDADLGTTISLEIPQGGELDEHDNQQ